MVTRLPSLGPSRCHLTIDIAVCSCPLHFDYSESELFNRYLSSFDSMLALQEQSVYYSFSIEAEIPGFRNKEGPFCSQCTDPNYDGLGPSINCAVFADICRRTINDIRPIGSFEEIPNLSRRVVLNGSAPQS